MEKRSSRVLHEADLTVDMASRLAGIALSHITREFPNSPGHVIEKDGDWARPSELHPVFYGSFDWHSCVHAYWLLARLYRRFPSLPERAQIRALYARHFVPDKIAAEEAYFRRPSARGFERPYGWAWVLMLAGELARHDKPEGRHWGAMLEPLTQTLIHRLKSHLSVSDYPVRAGVHSNTAFALALALDYARASDNQALAHSCIEKALNWYRKDEDCQCWEPSQDDFLSPALMEATLMAIALGPDFAQWFARFLPLARSGRPATLFTPAKVSDRSDGKIAHLDGLNLSRAWCWRRIARALPSGDRLRIAAEETAWAHIGAALPHIAGDYMGAHWLASFLLLAIDPWPDE